MFRKSLYFLLLTAITSSPVWSDDPIPKQRPLKQRVSPQVLKEAMALPEYRGKAPDSPEQLLEDLKKLSDKLRKNGDDEGADLLQRFIVEHERFISRSVQHAAMGEGKILVHMKVFEVKKSNLREDSVFNNSVCENSVKVQAELNHLITAGKAKICVEPFLVEGDTCVAMRQFSDGEFTVPLHDKGVAHVEIRDLGTKVEVVPTLAGKNRVRLQIHGTSSTDGDGEPLQETSKVSKREVYSTVEISFGDCLLVHFQPHASSERCVFFIIEPTPRF